jgi:hypothetical protein
LVWIRFAVMAGPIVFLHGVMVDGSLWDDVVALLG